MINDCKHFNNWNIFKLVFSKVNALDHEKDVENKLCLLWGINEKFNFLKNSFLPVITEHVKHLQITKYALNPTERLRELVRAQAELLRTKLAQLGDKGDRDHLKLLKPQFNFVKTC